MGFVTSPGGRIGHPFPVLRWVVGAWVVFFVPFYWWAHGPQNLVWFCDIAVILGSVGVLLGSPLLISSQAVGALVMQSVWTVEIIAHLLGRPIFGGIWWMFDPETPLPIRLVSLYHGVWPFFLVWCVWRVGYDRRALALQIPIALAATFAGRALGPDANINFSYHEPVFGWSWEPAALHVSILTFLVVVVAYLPAHALLRAVFGSERRNWRGPGGDPIVGSVAGGSYDIPGDV